MTALAFEYKLLKNHLERVTLERDAVLLAIRTFELEHPEVVERDDD